MWAALQRQMEWRAIPIAGFIAGTVFLGLVALFAPTLGLSLGVFLRYAAALVLGSTAVTASDPVGLVVGLIVNYVVCTFYALIIAIVVHRWGLLVGIVGGAILGLSLYAIAFFTVTLVFPWLYAFNSAYMALSHLIFGAVAGGVYEALDRYDRPLISEESAS